MSATAYGAYTWAAGRLAGGGCGVATLAGVEINVAVALVAENNSATQQMGATLQGSVI
ncbi:MAG TPA: hypothetical protein VN934_10410 [Candidatus Tumulicola sp.]|nr:hypothetical protein [Candidatus Tumulicola sp.]